MQFSTLPAAPLADMLNDAAHIRVLLQVPGFVLEDVTTLHYDEVEHYFRVHKLEDDEFFTFDNLRSATQYIECAVRTNE